MQFSLVGVQSDNEITKSFNKMWKEQTTIENERMAGMSVALSEVQHLTIDIYTGQVKPTNDAEEVVYAGILPAQMELEAIFRARSITMAHFMGNHGEV